MSESRVQMYTAELAEEVRREWPVYIYNSADDFARALASGDPLQGAIHTLSAIAVELDGLASLARVFGDFSGVDFTPCQQIKLDPPKPKSTAKPALAALSIEAPLQRYHGLGFCDAAEVRP